jgi:hypothetical protein
MTGHFAALHVISHYRTENCEAKVLQKPGESHYGR